MISQDPLKEVPDTTVLPEFSSLSQANQSPWPIFLTMAVSCLMVSVSLNFLFFKQYSELCTEFSSKSEVSIKLQQKERDAQVLLQELANYSLQHPDVRDILAKYGVTINITPPAAPQTPPPIPSPFPKK